MTAARDTSSDTSGDRGAAGPAELLGLARQLFPLTRSITGEGVRQTLRIIGELIPLTVHEVPTGTRVLDWEVPREWNIRDAFIANAAGERVVDFRRSNLHVMSYSTPVRQRLSLAELRPHLFSDPARPDVIPYRTSYYNENWGFCLSHRQLGSLAEGSYDVMIDSSLEPGSLSYGECIVRGQSTQEILFFTHVCHPSLANDNLSGIAVCTGLAKWLQSIQPRFTYRFVFAPGTIGSIAWLARNEATLERIRAGLVVALVGTRTPLLYKQSWSGTAEVDHVVAAYLATAAPDGSVIPFSPWGYDERQFGSPGFRLPVGRLTRAAEEGYPEYHSSADNLELLDGDALVQALGACRSIVRMFEANRRYRNTSPRGEPQLGRRGIYRAIGGAGTPALQRAILWVLNLSDGSHDLAAICLRSGIPFEDIIRAVELLAGTGLLETIEPTGAAAPLRPAD